MARMTIVLDKAHNYTNKVVYHTSMAVMQRTIEVGGETVPYELRRRRRHRHLTLSVREHGIILTAPYRVPLRSVEQFIAEKKQWLIESLSLFTPMPSHTKQEQLAHFKKHKRRARVVIVQRLEELCCHYNVSYKRVSVRNTRTRWGSCSSSGTLSFSHKVLFLPPHLRDYVLVHELCHLKEMNHSPRFWALVAECIPDHKERRKELHTWHLL